MKTSSSITKIAVALLKVQQTMKSVTKDSTNPYYKSKYADINSFLDVAVPALNANGIILLQPASHDERGHLVETFLMHDSGEFIASEPMHLELNKPDMQQLGSAITYARRYSLQSLLAMAASDDDANEATRPSVSKPSSVAPVKTPDTVKPVEVKPAVVAPVVAKTPEATPAPQAASPKPTFKKPSTNKPTW